MSDPTNDLDNLGKTEEVSIDEEFNNGGGDVPAEIAESAGKVE